MEKILGRTLAECVYGSGTDVPQTGGSDWSSGGTPLEREQMERRRTARIEAPAADLYGYVAEDILLQKARRFRIGGQTSPRQWRDIAGIDAVQGNGWSRVPARVGCRDS